MNWFRANKRWCGRLALIALAIQFVLSFGHFHSSTAQAAVFPLATAPSQPGAATSVDLAAVDPDRSNPGRDQDQKAHDPCAICAVLALANTVTLTEPTIFLLPQAFELLFETTDAEFAHLQPRHSTAQPRAPPAS